MEINPEKMSTEMETLIYEQPSLKKYGTMKELTLGSGGSRADTVGMGTGDPDNVNDTTDDAFNDIVDPVDGANQQ